MKLYHNPMSSCSQKVRLVLAEKKLPYEGEILDLQKGAQFSEEYLRLNPNALVPTLIDDGATFIESTLINEYLDDQYPEQRLCPETPEQRYRMRLFCRVLDDLVHPCLLYTSPSPRDATLSRMPSSA